MAETITHGAAGADEGPASGPVLCLIGCAAPAVFQLATVVRAALADGWRTCAVVTPTAARWLAAELPELARLTGCAVRSEYSVPGRVSPEQPRPDAVLVAPATANTVNKCAAGISDTLALGIMNTAIGMGMPISVAVAAGVEDRRHPAFAASTAILRGAGAHVFVPEHPDGALLPVTGDPSAMSVRPRGRASAPLRWQEALAVLTETARPGRDRRHPVARGAP